MINTYTIESSKCILKWKSDLNIKNDPIPIVETYQAPDLRTDFVRYLEFIAFAGTSANCNNINQMSAIDCVENDEGYCNFCRMDDANDDCNRPGSKEDNVLTFTYDQTNSVPYFDYRMTAERVNKSFTSMPRNYDICPEKTREALNLEVWLCKSDDCNGLNV